MKLPKSPFSRFRFRFGDYLKAHHFTRAGIAAAGLAATLVFFALGAVIRLLVGPVSLGPFSGSLSDALAEALPGISVRYDAANVEWSRDQGRVGLVILGARVFDADGRIIAQAPKAAIDLAAGSVFSGHPQVKRITLIGVQLTLVRTREGGLRLGVGKDVGQQDFLTNITDAITASSSKASSLQVFAIRDARIAILDEITGLFVVAPRADLAIQTAGRSLAASFDADLEISGRPARVHANLLFPPGKGAVHGDLTVSGLDVGALGANAKAFSVLKGIALAADMSASFTIDHGAHLSEADFGLDTHGTVGFPGLIVGPVRVGSARIVGRYDGNAGRLLVDDASLQSDQGSLHLVGDAYLKYRIDQTLSQIAFEATGDTIRVHSPGTFEAPFSFERLAVRGNYQPSSREIVVDHFGLRGGAFSAEAAGKVDLAQQGSAAVELKGTLAALPIHELLRYWPRTTAPGARDWVAHNLTAGMFGPWLIEAHLAPGALDQPVLPDASLRIVIPVANATINYLTGLTLVTGATGTTTLQGNSYSADFTAARIGPLDVAGAHVVIPQIGGVALPAATVSANFDGAVRDVLELLDRKPLNYPTRFGINPADTKGSATVALSVHVPLVRNVGVDQVALSVKATVKQLELPLGAHARLVDGNVDFDVNNARLIATGDASLAASRIALKWTEGFRSADPLTTHISVNGSLGEAARVALGLHTSPFLEGPVQIQGNLAGRHGQLANADIALDLTGSTVALDLVGIAKVAGVPASGRVTAAFGPGSAVRSEDIRFSSADGSLDAQMSFAADGTLQQLNLPGVKYGAANDFSLHVARSATSTDVSIRGHSLDGSGIAHEGTGSGSPNDKYFDGAYRVSAKLDRLVLRNGVSVAPFALDVAGTGAHMNAMSLNGALDHGGKISGSLVAAPSRRALFTVDDAGELAHGLFGWAGMRGGKLEIAANFPAVETAARETPGPDFQGKLDLSDATFVNQPFMARMLGMISFVGIGNLLQGSGLVMDHVEVPFVSRNGVISVRDAAASGPTLGLTADGYIDRGQNTVALKGSIIPVVGIDFNKVLGAIPLVGNIFVSKKGEGIFGVTYSVQGNADQPSVTVNPLAMLTPGILRRLFVGRIPVPSPPAGPPQSPQPTVKAPSSPQAK